MNIKDILGNQAQEIKKAMEEVAATVEVQTTERVQITKTEFFIAEDLRMYLLAIQQRQRPVLEPRAFNENAGKWICPDATSGRTICPSNKQNAMCKPNCTGCVLRKAGV